MVQRKRRAGSRNFHQLASLRLETLARQSKRYADADYRRKMGLGVLQCRVIGMVGSQGALTFGELCIGTEIDKSYASRLVANLVDLGFLRRSSDRSDQRSFVVALTAAGRRAYNQIYRIALQRNDTWLAALSPEQCEIFFACIDILERESRKHIAQSRLALGEHATPRAGVASARQARPVERSKISQQRRII